MLGRPECRRAAMFTADMVRYCGGVYRVARVSDGMPVKCSGHSRVSADSVALETVICGGEPAGTCSRRCYHLWKEAWLERVEALQPSGQYEMPLDETSIGVGEGGHDIKRLPHDTDTEVSTTQRNRTEISKTQWQLIAPGNRLWQEILEQTPHDFYHMPGYVRLSADFEGGKPLGFVAEEGEYRFFVPLVVRPIRIEGASDEGLFDATSPYGYPSPLLQGPPDEQARAAFLERALNLLLCELRQRDVVSLFLRLHPLLPLPRKPFCRHGVLVEHGETVFLDLTRSEEEIWRQTRKNYRSRINRARRSGAIARMDRECADLDRFIEIYWQTMRSVRADDEYFFSRWYFHELKDILGGALHLGTVKIDGRIACAGLFSEVGGIVEAHLLASRPEFVKAEPVKLMIDFAHRWAKERGNRVFHLGGGRGASHDSLFQFKSGFSRSRSTFLSWRAIICDARYNTLVRRCNLRHAADGDSPDGFFPGYRKSRSGHCPVASPAAVRR